MRKSAAQDLKVIDMMALRVLFIGASTVNFGGSPGPWDHSRRLEKLGGVKASTRTNPGLFITRVCIVDL